MKEGDLIFKETVASLFPEIVKAKPPPSPDPYLGGDKSLDQEEQYEDYLEIESKANEFVKANPYIYKFNWKQVLMSK